MAMNTMNRKIVAFGKWIAPDSLLPYIQRYYNKYYYDRPTIQKLISSHSGSSDPEIQDLVKYVSRHGLMAFPYEWANPYTSQNR